MTHDANKGGYSDCLAVALGTGHYAKQCHAFQAKSNREVRGKEGKWEGGDWSYLAVDKLNVLGGWPPDQGVDMSSAGESEIPV